MKTKKSLTSMVVISLFLLLIFTSLTSAQTGCFLHKESPFYCSDLSQEKAAEECLLYQDCDLTNVYYSQESCINKIKFPGCEVIFCKDNCQNEVTGKCLGGEILVTEKDQWCNPGCCYFEYYQDNYCSYEKTKTVCETEARNKDVTLFNFDSNKNQAQCLNFCANEEYSNPAIISSLVFEEVSPKNEDIVSFNELDVTSAFEENKEKSKEQKEIPEKNNWPRILLVVVFLLVLMFYLYNKKPPFKQWLNALFSYFEKLIQKIKTIFLLTRKEQRKYFMKKWERILIPLNSSPKIRRLISRKDKETRNKIKHFHNQELLNKFGLTKKQLTKKDIRKIKKLEKLVSSYERKIRYHPKEITKQEVSAFQKLEQIARLKEQNVTNIANIGHLEKNQKKITELSPKNNIQKTEDIISELKSIMNKRKKQ